MDDLEWRKSKCVGTWLHRFGIWKISDKCVVEICQLCGDVAYFSIVNGQTDNVEYLDYHLRSALTPIHPQYEAEYGKK